MGFRLRKFPRRELGNYLLVGLMPENLILFGGMYTAWGVGTFNGVLFLAGFLLFLIGYLIQVDWVPPPPRVAVSNPVPQSPIASSSEGTPSQETPLRVMIREELRRMLEGEKK